MITRASSRRDAPFSTLKSGAGERRRPAIPPIVIEAVDPEIDGGRFAVKRETGDRVRVAADIFKEGHDALAAALLYHGPGESAWRRAPMEALDNDRWAGSFPVEEIGIHQFTIEAWVEEFETWRRDTLRKQEAGQEIGADLLTGRGLFRALRPAPDEAGAHRAWSRQLGGRGRTDSTPLTAAAAQLLLSEELGAWAHRHAMPRQATRAAGIWDVVCDRPRARYGAWYEMFPRSQGRGPGRSATFADCEARLPELERMGFDVIYLPPIHPIGHTHRKGRNNALTAAPGEPGSPYAIGAETGGHDAIEPSLGTLADFDRFVAAAGARGMDVALDFAVHGSPDHPWVREHPEWFFHRPDGSIRYAENPPKRYEDIYPLDLRCAAWRSLWEELERVVEFWIAHGVRIFRVDNPHTKPFAFWRWLLGRVRAAHPEILFLSEAFTRPKVMRYLAKMGFSQSYTYFTWRNTKSELTEYLTELALTESREFLRPNFFTNTPDILPPILQRGGRPAFIQRLVLAATLSPSYGIYNGFELCEGRALPDSEEYADSEKYEFKVWDWDRPGNIKDVVASINRIRRENPALQRLDNIRFLRAENEQILFYAKRAAGNGEDNLLLIAVNLDPFATQASHVDVPLEELGIAEEEEFEIDDLLGGYRGRWRGRRQWVRLDPAVCPAHIFRVMRRGSRPA